MSEYMSKYVCAQPTSRFVSARQCRGSSDNLIDLFDKNRQDASAVTVTVLPVVFALRMIHRGYLTHRPRENGAMNCKKSSHCKRYHERTELAGMVLRRV